MKASRLLRARGQTGLTLVELMISLAIGLFLVAAVAGVYIAARNVFVVTHSATIMDENARTAFAWIGNGIRQARFDGCRGSDGAIVGDTRRGAFTDWWNDIGNPVRGYSLSATDSRFANSVANSDALTLIGIDSSRETTVVSDDPASATITTGRHAFANGETLLVTDCQLNSLFIKTGGSAGGGSTQTIVHGATLNCSAALGDACANGGSGSASYTLNPGALIVPLVANAYYVAPASNADKGRSLWNTTTEVGGGLSARELVGGVERLAFRFAVDTDGDGSINGYLAPTAITDWTQVKAVQVRLLLATLPDSGAKSTGSNAYTFNGATITPAAGDRRIYREYTAIFSLRNQ